VANCRSSSLGLNFSTAVTSTTRAATTTAATGRMGGADLERRCEEFQERGETQAVISPRSTRAKKCAAGR